MSTEYNRRHFGVAPKEVAEPRLSTPTNLNRRLTGDNGIYEGKSKPTTLAMPVKLPETFQTLTVEAPLVAGSLSWSKRKASGHKTVNKSDSITVTDPKRLKLTVE